MSELPSNKAGPESTVTVRHLVSLALAALGVVLILWFFRAFATVALGLLAAGIVTAALRPLKRLFPGPRWWSAALAAMLPTLFIVAGFVLVFWGMAEPIKREVGRLPEIAGQIDNQLAYWSGRLGLAEPVTLKGVASYLGQFMGRGVVATTTSTLGNALLALILIFFGSIYLLGEKPGRFTEPLTLLLSPERGRQLERAICTLEPKFRWWLLGTLIAMSVTGAATWIGYSVVGLQYAGPLALVAGLAEIVPTFGPLIAFLIALLFAAAQSGSSVAGIVIVYVTIQTLESYILQPLVMKKAVHMPPVVTLFTIVFWSAVFGPAGLILAIPLNMVIWSLMEHLVLQPRRARRVGSAD